MKTEIFSSEEITKEMALKELECACTLTQEEIDEYLDIISAINEGQSVYNLVTNRGEYLLYVKGYAVKDTKIKYKKSPEKDIEF